MIKYLDIHTSLEDLVGKASTQLGRPVFATGCTSYHGRRLRIQAEDGTVEIKSRWDLMPTLNQIEFVRRGEDDGSVWALVPAVTLQLMCPLLPGEYTFKDPVSQVYRGLGFEAGLGAYFHWECDETTVSAEWWPYLQEYRSALPPRTMVRGLRLLASGSFLTPNEVHENWHMDAKIVSQRAEIMQTVLPPGRFHGAPLNGAVPFNNTVLVDRDPGECLDCQGRSGERRHMGNMNYGLGKHPYSHNLICLTCLPKAMEQWMTLLQNWDPTK